MLRRKHTSMILALLVLLTAVLLSGCGAGGQTSPPTPDSSLRLEPATITIFLDAEGKVEPGTLLTTKLVGRAGVNIVVESRYHGEGCRQPAYLQVIPPETYSHKPWSIDLFAAQDTCEITRASQLITFEQDGTYELQFHIDSAHIAIIAGTLKLTVIG